MRRRSGDSSVSSCRRTLAGGNLDEGEGGGSTELACGDRGEESSTVVAGSDVLRIGQGDWLVEGLLLALCAFEGEVLEMGEIKTESGLVGEDLAALRERGVGILDVVRQDAGLETGLASRGRLVGIVVALTAGNDNWYVSALGMVSEHS